MKKLSSSLLAFLLLMGCQKDVEQKEVLDEQPVLPETAQRGGKPFIVTLTGAEEAPGPGDPDGTGTAELHLNQGQETISYKIVTSGIATTTGAHIHRGPVGQPGPIVVHLSAVANGTTSGEVHVDKELVKEIRKNPEAFYVNVHTVEYRPGAIRGQLSY